MTKYLLILLIALVFEAIGVVFLSKGLKQLGDVLFGEQQRIAGEKLIAIKDHEGMLKFGDTHVGIIVPAAAHWTGGHKMVAPFQRVRKRASSRWSWLLTIRCRHSASLPERLTTHCERMLSP